MLLREGASASFYHAVLALERAWPDAPALGFVGPAERERIRVRPSIRLACPPTDLEAIAPIAGERVLITTTFLGLYGADSPLPTHFAEHLAQISLERSGERVRAFLDIFHHRLYSLLFRAWKKSRPTAADPRATDPLFDRLLSLVGYSKRLGLGGNRPPRLFEARLRVLRTRTAGGLEALLLFRMGYGCAVDQLERRVVRIPLDQCTKLGEQNSTLGSSLVVGTRLVDCNKLCLRVAATSFGMYERLLPEGLDRQQVDDVVGSYLNDPIDYDLEVTLPAEHVPPWQLGAQGVLGRTVWCGTPRPHAVVRWRCRAFARAA